MSYFYEKDAVKKGKSCILMSAMSLVFAISIQIFFINFFLNTANFNIIKGFSFIVSVVATLFVWIIVAIIIFVLVPNGIKLIRSGGGRY